jgi:hypothetical protein
MILLPRLYNAMCRYWGVAPALAIECWTALEAAAGVKPRAWRETLLTYGAGAPDAVDGFVRSHMHPRMVVEALEGLVEEGRLTRVQATQVENCVLRRVRADGTWQP